MSFHEIPVFTLEDLEATKSDLHFARFDQADAYALGTTAAAIITERKAPLAVAVRIGDHQVFKAALGGVSRDTDGWLRRKAATAERFGVSSLLVRRRIEAGQLDDSELDEATYASHGGSYPIIVAGTVVGSITISGLEDVVDHDVAVRAIRASLIEGF